MRIIKTKKYAQMSQNRWDNSPGEIYVELIIGEDGNLYDITNDKDISRSLKLEIIKFVRRIPIRLNRGSQIELAIDFSSSGYDDPGSMHGGLDQLGYPPEGEDERTVTSVKLLLDGKLIGSLSEGSKNVNHIVEQEYAKEIKNADTDRGHDEDSMADYEYDLGKDEPGRIL